MSKEKGCKCCKQIWYEDILDKKWKLCPNCYEYCKPLIDDLKIKDKKITDLQSQLADKEKKQNQKAIEQLEKVKNEITPIFCVPNGIYSNLHNEVFKTIDNQIKQLKRGKSGKV